MKQSCQKDRWIDWFIFSECLLIYCGVRNIEKVGENIMRKKKKLGIVIFMLAVIIVMAFL